MHSSENPEIVGQSEPRSFFFVATYWLVPWDRVKDIPLPMPDLRDGDVKTIDFISPASSAPERTFLPESEAWARTEKLRKDVAALIGATQNFYNSQPIWHLKQLSISSANEARAAAREFIAAVSETSSEYCWPTNLHGKGQKWRAHGWKHVSYGDMTEFWLGHSRGSEPAAIRAEVFGEAKDIEKLFVAAADNDAEAVGNIWAYFPSREDQREIIEYFCHQRCRPARIPHPTELACELVEIIFANPYSAEAARAREALRKLVSVSTLRGSKSKRGRPQIRAPKSSLTLLWQMGYCLARQVCELNDLLETCPEPVKDRLTILFEAYPWISRIARNFSDFLSFGRSKAALEIVANLTEMSSSSLEKMGLRARS